MIYFNDKPAVPADTLKRCLKVGPPKGFYQYPVFLHYLVGRAAFTHRLYDQTRHVVAYLFPQRPQLCNAEKFNDRRVELHILLHKFDGVILHPLHLVGDDHELSRQHLRALCRDYLSHDEGFDHLAQQKKLILVVGIYLGYYYPLMFAPQHLALLREALQRVAYGCAADSHLRGESPVHERITGGKLAVDYLLFYRLIDIV